MGKKLTQDEWIEIASKKWQKIYDYSQVKYVTSKDKVTVICKVHGPWQVLPVNHVSGGRGCPKCGIQKNRLNLIKPVEKFIEQARKIHGSRYSYDASSYAGAKTPIAITCPDHGIFFQSPEVHLRPHYCPRCSKKSRQEKEKNVSVLDVQKRIHESSKGVVSLIEKTFSTINSKADFLCSIHGTYKRLVNTALHSKHPCVECSRLAQGRGSIEIDCIKSKVNEKFGAKYSYEISTAKNLRKTKLKFTCNLHGQFNIAYPSLSRSPGCPDCARQISQSARTAGLQKKNAETIHLRSDRWVSKAKHFHGEKFNYSKVQYLDAKTPVTIICPTHGEFLQLPDSHLTSGCRACADEELLGKYSEKYFVDNPTTVDKDATLYYIKLVFGDEVFYKVGITTTSVRNRFGMARAGGVKVAVLHTIECRLIDAFRAEQTIQKSHGERFRYRPIVGGKSPRELRIGPSECFSNELPADMIFQFFKTHIRT